MTIDTTTGHLTRLDIKALRGADAVIFTYRPDGAVYIEAIKKDEDEFGETTRRRDVPARGVIQGAGGQFGLPKLTFRAASVHIGSARFHSEWQTITQLLRPDDDIVLEFGADYFTTETLMKTNLHADTLVLRVERDGKRMSFLVDVRIAPHGPSRICRETQ